VPRLRRSLRDFIDGLAAVEIGVRELEIQNMREGIATVKQNTDELQKQTEEGKERQVQLEESMKDMERRVEAMTLDRDTASEDEKNKLNDQIEGLQKLLQDDAIKLKKQKEDNRRHAHRTNKQLGTLKRKQDEMAREKVLLAEEKVAAEKKHADEKAAKELSADKFNQLQTEKISCLEGKVVDLERNFSQLNAAFDEMKVQLKRACEERESQHKEETRIHVRLNVLSEDEDSESEGSKTDSASKTDANEADVAPDYPPWSAADGEENRGDPALHWAPRGKWARRKSALGRRDS